MFDGFKPEPNAPRHIAIPRNSTAIDQTNPTNGTRPHPFQPADDPALCMCGAERFTSVHVAIPKLSEIAPDSADALAEFKATGRDKEWWASSVRGDALDLMVFEPLQYLVHPFLSVGGLVMLAAPPKSFKSLFALSCSLAVASGGKALGRVDAETGRVLYLSLDDASLPRAQRRIREHLGPGVPIPSMFELHTAPDVGQGKVAAKRLDRYLTAHEDCRLIIVDTLEHLRDDHRSGDYRADVQAMARFRWLLERHPKVTILVLMHTRKGDDDDAVTAVGGTHGVTGGADVILRITGKRGVPKRVIEVVNRDDEDLRKVLQITASGLILTDEDPDDPSVMLAADDQTLYRAIRDGFGEGATAADLGTAYPSITRIGTRLSRMAKDGYLQRRARGSYVTS